MGKQCAWGTCKSNNYYEHRYPECLKKDGQIDFFPFVKAPSTKPWNREKCLKWIEACGRPESELNFDKVNKGPTTLYICSRVSIRFYVVLADKDSFRRLKNKGRYATPKLNNAPIEKRITVCACM